LSTNSLARPRESFGGARVTRFSTLDEAVELACDAEWGLALGIFTADVATGLPLAGRIPTATAHINDQTLRNDAHVPFGGMRNSGNASRFGTAAANIEAYTDTRWITVQPTPLPIRSDPEQMSDIEVLTLVGSSRAASVNRQIAALAGGVTGLVGSPCCVRD
jgi:hypothetical protein